MGRGCAKEVDTAWVDPEGAQHLNTLPPRLHEARMLIVNCTGLAAEVAKNVVLAGIGSVTLQHDAQQPRPTANFLACAACPDGDVAQATASELQEMNPLVKVTADDANSDTSDVYHAALLVVSATTGLADAVAWADRLRTQGTRVFVAASRGTTSWFFQDLGDAHSFTATVCVPDHLHTTRPTIHFNTGQGARRQGGAAGLLCNHERCLARCGSIASTCTKSQAHPPADLCAARCV